jgi:hypothetical protein
MRRGALESASSRVCVSIRVFGVRSEPQFPPCRLVEEGTLTKQVRENGGVDSHYRHSNIRIASRTGAQGVGDRKERFELAVETLKLMGYCKVVPVTEECLHVVPYREGEGLVYITGRGLLRLSPHTIAAEAQ